MARYLRLTRGTPGQVNGEGVEPLRLALWDGGKEVDHLTAYSGAPGAQNFRTLAQELRGVLEPIPEGTYKQLGDLEWAGGVGNYSKYWSAALGPVVATLYGDRAILLHLDANRSYSPGSAGCVCPIDMEGLQKAVGWWRAGVPAYLEVDWGLGTVKKPVGNVSSLRKVKLYKTGKKTHSYKNGLDNLPLGLKFDYHDKKIGVALDGHQLDPEKIESVEVVVIYRE